MSTVNNTYPSFEFSASELSAFGISIDVFTISLKDGKLIHFTPDDRQAFRDWLMANGVRDIKTDIPILLEDKPGKKSTKWYKRLIKKVRGNE